MELPLIHIYTHDSIGVGEDGPTHQPIEHLASIRAMPGVIDMRPGDANEVVEAWRVIMPIRHEPVALMLSRQPLPTLDRTPLRPRVRRRPRRVRPRRPARGRPRGHPHRHRQRGRHDRRRLRAAHRRRDPGAGGEHAVDGAVRQAAVRLPRGGPAAGGDGPGRGGEGQPVRLGPLGRLHRRGHRHEHLRRVRTHEGAAGQVRVHDREHRGDRPGTARAGPHQRPRGRRWSRPRADGSPHPGLQHVHPGRVGTSPVSRRSAASSSAVYSAAVRSRPLQEHEHVQVHRTAAGSSTARSGSTASTTASTESGRIAARQVRSTATRRWSSQSCSTPGEQVGVRAGGNRVEEVAADRAQAGVVDGGDHLGAGRTAPGRRAARVPGRHAAARRLPPPMSTTDRNGATS